MCLKTVGTLFCLFACFATAITDTGQPPMVLIMVVSGMRWDILNFTGDGFKAIQQSGVRASHLQPVFPGLAQPNLYTIATGMYAEDHGVIGDNMYDRVRNEWFLGYPDPNTSHSYWWEKSEPIWIRAAKLGLRTELYFWPGCEVEYQGRRPDVCVPYRPSQQLSDVQINLESVLNSFQTGALSFAMVYVDYLVDKIRSLGPVERELFRHYGEIDALLLNLIDKMKSKHLYGKVNLLVMSDRGFSGIDQKTMAIRLENQPEISKVIDSGGMMSIFPVIGREDMIYNSLKQKYTPGLRVYRLDELPDHWKYRNNPKTPPITLIADPGYILTWGGDNSKLVSPRSPYWRGIEGYDPFQNGDMRGVFLATGPEFREGGSFGLIQAVDVYSLLCHLLVIAPQPNQGNWEHVRVALREPWRTPLPMTSAGDRGGYVEVFCFYLV